MDRLSIFYSILILFILISSSCSSLSLFRLVTPAASLLYLHTRLFLFFLLLLLHLLLFLFFSTFTLIPLRLPPSLGPSSLFTLIPLSASHLPYIFSSDSPSLVPPFSSSVFLLLCSSYSPLFIPLPLPLFCLLSFSCSSACLFSS